MSRWTRKPHEPEAIARLELDLPGGRGRAHAPIVWLALASFLTWGKVNDTRVWPTNEKLARITGCPLRAVELGIAHLRRASKITTTRGWRRRCGFGRIIELHLLGEGPNPRVTLPSPADMRALWAKARTRRDRPATVVALALAAYVQASAEGRGKLGKSRALGARLAQIRRLVGASHGSTFSARLDVLAQIGILARAGALWRDGVVVFGRWSVRALQRAVAWVGATLPVMPLRRVRSSQEPPAKWTGPPPEFGDGPWELVLEAG